METQSVQCNHCGAPLEVGKETRFVTCQFCNSQLEIKRTESTIFTEEIAKITQNTERMAGAASSHGAAGIFALMPIGMGIFALVAGIMGIGKANNYESRKSDYEQKRAAMVARLDAARRG